MNLLGLTPDTKLVVKIASSSQTANKNNRSLGSGCSCIACECNTFGTSPALSEFAALKCVLLQHLSADESKRRRASQSGSTPIATISDSDVLSSPQSPLSYYPFPIPLGVAKFRMPSNRFKVENSDDSPPTGDENERVSEDGGKEQVAQGIFLVYKKACSLDRLYYDFPDGFDIIADQKKNNTATNKGGSGKFIGDEGLLGHWTAQLLRILDTLHVPRPIYPSTSHTTYHSLDIEPHSSVLYSVVHKDVKIKNVLVSGTGYLHLVDFGCAVIVPSYHDNSEIAQIGNCFDVAKQALLQTTGTVTTRAPELTIISPSSSSLEGEYVTAMMSLWVRGALMDVFGLGVVLLEMMNSRQTNGATHAEYERLHSMVSSENEADGCSVASSLVPMIKGMIQPSPLLRYQSCCSRKSGGMSQCSPMRSLCDSRWIDDNGSRRIGVHPYPVQFTASSLIGHQQQHCEERMAELVGDHWNTTICPGFSEEAEEEVDMQTLGL
jgi:hypothetical protein